MNLNVSYNWLKEYLPGLKASPEEVAEKLSLHSFSVEKINSMDENLDGVVVGGILEINKHPNADKLSVARVDVGKDKPIQLIFGQMVVMRVGDKVPVALAPTTLPDGRKIEKAKLRGQVSEGMLCLDQELGLLETGVSIRHFDASVKNGTPIAKALELDDTIFEVEITTNRSDAMSIIGLAREVGAIFGIKSKVKSQKSKGGNNSPRPPLTLRGGVLSVKVETPKLCPRYIAVVMDEIKVAPSPWWMQRRLIASGVRPINNIVDITNYVLLEYGQPCHAFDADKIDKIVVRKSKKGEKILALDGKTYDLDENILVIANSEKPIAIAGIMGGEETGVRTETTRIVYEIANFDPVAVRKGERQLCLSSDSSIRFDKGLPDVLPQYAAGRLIDLTREIAGGEVAGMVDKKARACKLGRIFILSKDIVNKIGVDIPGAQIKKYLTRLGFDVNSATKRRRPPLSGGERWQITFPYWRVLEADGVADIAEEVARMYGYHKLPSVLPQGDLPDELPDFRFDKEYHIKEILRGAGFTEMYTYSFVSGQDIEKAGLKHEDALAVANPLTSELSHMRPWLGISILKAIAQNEKQKEILKLFEFSSEYHARPGDLPDERQKLIVVSAGKETTNGEHFYAIKGTAEHLAKVFALPSFNFEKVGSINAPWVKHYHPSRVLLCKSGRDILGVAGELHPSLIRMYGIEKRVAFLEWEANAFLPLINKGRVYTPPLQYPAVKRDISFVISKQAEYNELYNMMRGIDPLVYEVELFDQYEGKGMAPEERSMAFHISYASQERTLTAEEADRAHARISKMLEKKFGAKVRS